MDEKIEESPKEEKKSKSFLETLVLLSRSDWYRMAKFFLIILAVVALGMYVITTVIDYRYKVAFIKTPCELCAELNKNQSMCIAGCFKQRVALYPNGLGGWSTNNGSCYDLNGIVTPCENSSPVTFHESNFSLETLR